MAEKRNKKLAVEESEQTRRAREKLKKKLQQMEENSSERVILYSKNISLFDENQNTAKASRKVSEIAEKLRLVLEKAQETVC
jgi:hypothetical protein